MEKESIAIITARGGSKRIPKKNIKDFCGKPIIAYSIEAALDSGVFDKVMVSTDSKEIAEIAKQYGAKVPFMRSEKTADDFATTADVLLEVLDQYGARGENFSIMSCIYPTAPFVTAERLRQAYEIIQNDETIPSLMPVVPFSYPPQRGYIMDNGRLQIKQPEYLNTRSQDLETIYHDAGQFYFYRVKEYLQYKGQYTTGVYPLVLSDMEVQDIDNETDWKMAELKYHLAREN